jgi:hypothetical protein
MTRIGIILFLIFQCAQADTDKKEYWKDCPGPGCPAREENSMQTKERLQDKLDTIREKEKELHMEKEKIREQIKGMERGQSSRVY